jgi:hypothetical protein
MTIGRVSSRGALLMDFVTVWKASSIVLTGTFGILGLVKEFKNKKTGKITIWGRVSLAGILLSTGLGVVAQLKESSASSAASLKLAQKSDRTLDEIERLLTPLSEPSVEVHYVFECGAKERFRDSDKFCNDLHDIQMDLDRMHTPDPESLADYYRLQNDPAIWKKYPSLLGDSLFIDVKLMFFADPSAVKRYLANPNSVEPDLQMRVRSYRKDLGTDALIATVDEKSVDVTTKNEFVHEITSAQSMTSIRDLPGTTLLIEMEDSGYGFGGFRPTSMTMTTQNGLQVSVPSFTRTGRVYQYVFPKAAAP